MALKSRKPPARRPLPSLPENGCWIQSDAYDRRIYRHLRSESASLRELEQSGGTFLPQFGSLLQDVFSLLFKYNIVFHDERDVLPSALLNRGILDGIRQGAQYEFLREQTTLNEARAGLSTLLLGERLLALLRAEKVLTRRDMRDQWDIERQEQALREKIEELQNSETIPEERMSEEGADALQKAKERLAGEVQGAEALLRQKTRQLREDLERIEPRLGQRLQAEAIQVARQLEEASEQAETWGATLGTGARTSAGEKLELGKRLAGNEKLKKLARMVGRMRFHALALRKKVFERSSEEVLEVERGDSIHRLLPHEMLTLHHPTLRKDFFRRYLDQELIQYSLRGAEEKGKGPMIVCLDGSSSMAGDKEIWSKAVALTLLEIARRQRRLFRSICFSSQETPLQVLDLNPKNYYQIETRNVMEMAEYFPGGGTDFQKPLEAALECLKQAPYRRGDIVFITDGECEVGAEWAEQFRKDKEKLGFSLFSILIDVGPSSLGSLKAFSDRITTIKQLTGDEARDVFISL